MFIHPLCEYLLSASFGTGVFTKTEIIRCITTNQTALLSPGEDDTQLSYKTNAEGTTVGNDTAQQSGHNRLTTICVRKRVY